MDRRIITASAAVVAAVFSLCACEKKIEYPEGVDTLPSYSSTDTGVVTTIYDTRPTTVYTLVTTTVTETETDSETTTTEAPTQTETETTTATTVPFSLGLEDIPDVDISDYHANSVTTSSIGTMPVTQFVSSVTEPTLPSASDVSGVVTVSETSVSDTVPAETDASGNVIKHDAFVQRPEEQLRDGRVSAYTGRTQISHPYSYYQLSKDEQVLYDLITEAMLCYEDKLYLSDYTYTFDEVFDVYQLIFNDEYRLFYISPTIEYIIDSQTDYVKTMKLQYVYKEDEVLEMRQKIYTEADKILSQLKPEMGDYEIVKHIHDSVIRQCTYASDVKNPNTIYGCLVDKFALCQAYSRTFTYLCSEVGIETFAILGVADEPHMWNVVKMDGEYYHIDLTWDDPDREKNPDSIRYDYFGLTDERIKQLRQVDPYDYKVPEAKGTKYQYYYYNGLVADSLEKAREILTAETLKAAENKSSTVQFMCSDSVVFKEVTDVFFSSSGENVISTLDSVKNGAANKYNTESIYHNSNKNTLTVKIYLDYLD